MSTSHTGPYCAVKDKMMLTKEEAAAMLRRLKKMKSYRCPHCGSWHITSTRSIGMKKR